LCYVVDERVDALTILEEAHAFEAEHLSDGISTKEVATNVEPIITLFHVKVGL